MKKLMGVMSVMMIGMPSMAMVSEVVAPLEKTPNLSPMTDENLELHETKPVTLNLGVGMARHINEAIVTKNWQDLEVLLSVYPTSEEYDPLLHKYAQGALYRHQLKHGQAILAYQEMLAINPELHYVRFDLAVMLFEDKRYDEAMIQFEMVKPFLNANLQALVIHYMGLIGEQQKPDIHLNVNYETTDNVNNASSATQIHWQGRIWQKSDDSLPKKATGVRYGVLISKDKGLYANHYLTASGSLDGVHYWDRSEYDEETVSVGLGYKYQNVVSSVSVVPFLEYTWLNDSDYQHETGLKVHINRRLNSQLNVGVGVQYAKRYYDDDNVASRYDATVTRANISYRYALRPNVILFGGADVTDDKTINQEYASMRYGINMGLMGELDNGVGGRVSVRYARRDFDVPERLLYGFIRQDAEYYVQTAWWYNRLQYRGFVPTLNLYYRKIDSNMAGLYSRDGMQLFVSVDKRF